MQDDRKSKLIVAVANRARQIRLKILLAVLIGAVFNSFTGGSQLNGVGSGFFNTATGGPLFDGVTSGFFNTGVVGPIPGLGVVDTVSGVDTGLGNLGTAIAGVFNLARQ